MTNVAPNYSRARVDKSARVFIDDTAGKRQREIAMGIVSNWRSAHAFPLNTIYMDMKRKAERIHTSAISVQRLKRQRSLISKLKREPSMRLTQMQDIGGCRTVLEDINQIRKLLEAYKNSQAEHVFVEKDDYIKKPKDSGYRSLHLVYRYKSKTRPEYNDLLFEIQIRTELQHAWATAVETVGAVLGQSLKASEGELAWLDFFRHASAAFAYLENSAAVPNIGLSRRELAISLGQSMMDLDVENILESYSSALRATEGVRVKDAGYFLLVLRPKDPTLEIFAYKKGQLDQAYKDYSSYEAELPLSSNEPGQLSLFPEFEDYSGAQAVLVGAQSFKSLRQSYPNYYLDTRKFISALKGFTK